MNYYVRVVRVSFALVARNAIKYRVYVWDEWGLGGGKYMYYNGYSSLIP